MYEIKFDGYRIMTRFHRGEPSLITRRGHNWSSKMPQLVKELRTIGMLSSWLDGEIVIMNDDGVPDFNALQNSLDQRTSTGITYFVFDVPFYEGYDLRRVPLLQRRHILEQLLSRKVTDHVRFSEAFQGRREIDLGLRVSNETRGHYREARHCTVYIKSH